MISPSHTSKECVHVCVWGMDDLGKGGLRKKILCRCKIFPVYYCSASKYLNLMLSYGSSISNAGL